MLIQILGDFLKEKLLMYDYIIIGAGLYGSVFAQRAKAVGKKVLFAGGHRYLRKAH